MLRVDSPKVKAESYGDDAINCVASDRGKFGKEDRLRAVLSVIRPAGSERVFETCSGFETG